MITLGINGFGRIGRLAFRIAIMNHRDEVKIGAINTSGKMNTEGWMHLLKYDSNYKKFPFNLDFEEIRKPKEVTDDDPLIGYIILEGEKIPVMAQKDPEKLPWGKYGVEVVIESTGVFLDQEGASKHFVGGARKVVLSAPAKADDVPTYVLGVNKTGTEKVISNASCTTNCIAPVAKIMLENFGVQKAMMTTIHSFTDDQRLTDNSHKDLRRARAAGQNIVPTTTGAASATGLVVPGMTGKFDGIAIRVPTPCGSVADFVFLTEKNTTVEEVNKVFENAANSPEYQGIIEVTRDAIVSSDIVGETASSVIDLEFTQVVGGNLVKVLAWYDNEWGYTNRLVEQAIVAGSIG